MAGLDFKAPVAKEQEDEAIIAHNARMGLWLFVVYVGLYGGFMAMSVSSALIQARLSASPTKGMRPRNTRSPA